MLHVKSARASPGTAGRGDRSVFKIDSMDLNFKSFGQGPPVVILHGLLGSLDNWQTLGRELAEDYTVFIVDQRNHGRSPHDPEMNYPAMAADLARFLERQWVHHTHVIGHSMGGKTAMTLADRYPGLVDRLVVVDIGPKAYPPGHELILDALQSVPLDRIEDRGDAEDFLAKRISSRAVRLFLMKNLAREKQGFRWKMNLPALVEHYDDITAAVWPAQAYEGDTLFIRGGNSDYIPDEDWPGIQASFPNAELLTIEGAGHWVHAEKPTEILAAFRSFFS